MELIIVFSVMVVGSNRRRL